MRPALVNLAVATGVFVAEGKAEVDCPVVVGRVGANPLGRGVILVRAFVRLVRARVSGGKVVGDFEHAGSVNVPC